MLPDFTQSQVRDLLAITPETMRHWRKVLKPLSSRRRRTKFSSGDLVALASIREFVRGLGISSSALAPRATEIFELCNSQAWHALTRQRLQMEKDAVSLAPVRSPLPVPSLERMTSQAAAQTAAAMYAIDDSSNRAFEISLAKLDEAVCNLYEFGKHECLVVAEGLSKAQREYAGNTFEKASIASSTAPMGKVMSWILWSDIYLAAMERRQLPILTPI